MTRLAWRLASRNRGRLAFLAACLAAGVAFLAAGDLLMAALGRAVAGRARDMLAADVSLSSARPFTPAAEAAAGALAAGGGRVTALTEFSSMLRAEGPEGVPRLVSVKAVEPAYPLYGVLAAEPPGARARLAAEDVCLVDESAARQHGLSAGSRVRLGALSLTVAGVVTKESGRAMSRFQFAPSLFLPRRLVEKTGLVQFGSRIHHELLAALPPSADPERAARAAAAELEKRLADPHVYVAAYPEAEPTTRQSLGRLSSYFTLTALVTLLLGAGGMAAGLSAFLDDQMETAAVLRCLGMTAAEAAGLYRTLCLGVGLAAGVLGVLGGWGLSAAALAFLGRFTGLELAVSPRPDAGAVLEAMAVAVVTALAAAEARVRALARVAPLEVLRDRAERLPPTPRGTALLLAAAAAGVYLYTAHKTQSPETARWFTLAVGGTSAALALAVSAALTLIAGAAGRLARPVELRLGLLSLSRRRGRGLSLLFTLAAGFGLLGALDLVRHSLAAELALSRAAGAPDLFLVDVQKSQLEGVRALARRYGKGEPSFSPLVRARLTAVDGVPVARRAAGSLDQEGREAQRFLLREFNLSYADALNPSERLVAGRFWGPGETGPQASVEEAFAKRTGLRLGSRLEFDVAGRPVEAAVTSLRSVNWVSMRPNFFVVLPAAVLAAAPQAHIGSLAVRDGPREAEFRRGLGEAYPNVSVIDAGRLLDQVREVLEAVLAALRGLAWFCVAVGLLVMAGTLAVGHRERRRDAALLRALGAATRQLVLVDLAAFGAAGLATFVLGTGAALLMGTLLARRLDVPFAPDAPGLLAVLAAALVLPAAVGLAVVSPAYRAPALETLRRDE